MAYGPCKNQNCNSYGRPHPNCRCYGEMAEGGEVKSFCSEDRMHNEDCEYFAKGGMVEAGNEEVKLGAEIGDDDPTEIKLGKELADDDVSLGAEIPDDDPTAPSTSEKALATAEGFGRGMLGPIETVAAKVGQMMPKESLIPFGQEKYGLRPEDIKARKEANPELALAGEAAGLVTGAVTGLGMVGAASKAGQAAAHVAELGKLGSGVISNFVANGMIQGADEANNWLLGKGDSTDAVGASLANVGAAGLLGAAGGAVSHYGTKLAQSLSNNKFIGKFEGFLSGIGAGAKSTYDKAAVEAAEKAGMFSHYDKSFGNVKKAYDVGKNAFTRTLVDPVHIGASAAAYGGYQHGGMGEALENFIIAEGIGHGVTFASKKAIVPVITKALESGKLMGLNDSIQHGINVVNGNNLINKSIDTVLKGGTAPAIQWFHSEEQRLKERNKLDEYIEKGGINQDLDEDLYQLNQGGTFAEGGLVKTPKKVAGSGLADHYPDQAMLIMMAKTRVSNYLSNLRPQKFLPGLLFDDPPDQTEKKRSYGMALDIANRPLSILNDVKKGTIDPEQVKHFQSLYPEINQLLQKRLTNKMVARKLEDKKPSYIIRQGLSLLLGTPLSSDLAPENIQAIQATFALGGSAEASPPVTKNKKNTSSLSDANDQFSTPTQARQESRQSRK